MNNHSTIDGISVVVTTFNGERWIESAISSILNQDTCYPIELIIVDDNSSDNSIEKIHSFNDSRIRVYCNSFNKGTAASRNIGITHATYRWIAFNDQDDVWLPNKLSLQTKLVERYPNIDGVAGGYARLAPDGQQRWNANLLFKTWSPSHSPTLSNAPFYSPATDGPCYIQSLIVKKEVLNRIGGFRENLPITYDPDIFFRIGESATLTAIDRPVFLYRLTSESITGSNKLKPKEFLASFAFIYAAQKARLQKESEPDIDDFIESYQPNETEIEHFTINQTLRKINTRWVNDGIIAAGLESFIQLFKRPTIVIILFRRARQWS